MKISTGIVTGRETRRNKDGSRASRVLQVQVTSPDDVQSIEQIGPGGQDFSPPDGSRVVILEIGSAYKVAIAVDDLQEPEAAPGERRIYSVSDEDIKALIYLFTNGNIEITSPETETTGHLKVGTGATGTFTSGEGKVITVQDGIIIGIV